MHGHLPALCDILYVLTYLLAENPFVQISAEITRVMVLPCMEECRFSTILQHLAWMDVPYHCCAFHSLMNVDVQYKSF